MIPTIKWISLFYLSAFKVTNFTKTPYNSSFFLPTTLQFMLTCITFICYNTNNTISRKCDTCIQLFLCSLRYFFTHNTNEDKNLFEICTWINWIRNMYWSIISWYFVFENGNRQWNLEILSTRTFCPWQILRWRSLDVKRSKYARRYLLSFDTKKYSFSVVIIFNFYHKCILIEVVDNCQNKNRTYT